MKNKASELRVVPHWFMGNKVATVHFLDQLDFVKLEIVTANRCDKIRDFRRQLEILLHIRNFSGLFKLLDNRSNNIVNNCNCC